ncbi:MAG: peptide-methionine (S)-S-oxide reductase MsrA [Bacteroidales bacterium]|nr:peptide-methionine (S)-S-oxide reductase MsrA [Bacteroidales bacterium]
MTKTIFLAGGCFWGTQHYLKQIEGVIETQTGFANGNTEERTRSLGIGAEVVEQPTYEQVYTDRTGYAETVRVTFDPSVLPLRKLVELYFLCIEPTSLNRQGNDEGTRYRTGIYYIDPDDRLEIMDVYNTVQHGYSCPLAVEVEPLERFTPASEYHQDYLDKHPDGYCHLPESLFEFARQANRRQPHPRDL